MNRIRVLWEKSFTHWPYRWTLHLCFWVFYLYFWLGESLVVSITPEQHYWVTFVGAIFVIFLYYGLTYWVWPLFSKKKWIWAVLSLIVFYASAVILRTYHINLVINWYNLQTTSVAGGQFWKHLREAGLDLIPLSRTFFSGLASLLMVVYVPLSIKFMRYVYQSNQQRIWMIKQNDQLQLNTLKAQINPHFFFNTLNNLQSFIVQNEKDRSVDLLNRLADFMRASLYDGGKEFITMEKEIALLNNYINIEKVRFEENAKIRYSLALYHPDYLIPPFIFLPFIENAFKHGGSVPANEIDICITLLHSDESITLTSSNTFLHLRENASGGIGLQNVRKRLDYYFPGRYQLDITIVDNTFTVNLDIRK